jgi:hypothetical protein
MKDIMYSQISGITDKEFQWTLWQVYMGFHLLPQKPSEIALGNGISRHLGGVLGIVFN